MAVLVINSFRNIKTFIFDLDGTIWKWTYLLPNVKEVITKLQSRGRKVYFISNNAVLSRIGFAKKLTEMGIRTDPKQVINAGYVAAKYFEEQGIDNVYVIGEKGLIEEMSEAGIKVSEKPKDVQAVLLATDRNFNYWKLKTAHDMIQAGAQLFKTGHGKYWHVGTEVYPGEETIVKAVEAMTGKQAILLGKPSDIMRARLLADVSLFSEDTLMVGDELNSDIAFGNKCGFKTALVLTGTDTPADLKLAKAEEKPDAVITEFKELISSY